MIEKEKVDLTNCCLKGCDLNRSSFIDTELNDFNLADTSSANVNSTNTDQSDLIRLEQANNAIDNTNSLNGVQI